MMSLFRTEKSMKGLRERLETAYKASGGRKVNIISHSMGGLLVSCFVALHNEVCNYVRIGVKPQEFRYSYFIFSIYCSLDRNLPSM